jgi:hypothetical protein
VHQIQIDIVHLEILQRAGDALCDALVPWIVELGGDPNLLSRYTRGLDTVTDLLLIAIRERTVYC